MKTHALAVCLALLASPLALAADITGSGKAISATQPVSGFHAISISVPGRVDVAQGSTESLMLTADDNVAPLIETVVEEGVLRIRFRERGRLNVHPRTPIRISVGAKALEGISVAGSSEVHAQALATAKLKVSIAGSGDVSLSGRAESFEASVAGSGNIKAASLDTRASRITIAGSGDALVWARARLKASIAGSGDVRYYGDPVLEKSVAGSGSVRRLGAAPG